VSAPPPAAADLDRPLGPADLARLLEPLGPFEAMPKLAVAVSGGPDSMALAILARAWVEARGGTLLALVVDHRLRPESTAEAGQAAAWLAALGIPAQVLAWQGPKPAAGIQAAAREARYRLLADACRAAGILHLLLAHHADDQAETVAMRAGRGSGPAGLAGMAAVRELEGLRVLRPLLAVPKARLVATLKAAGQPWLEDPSNRSPRFARTGLRQDEGFAAAAWREEGERQASARAERDRMLARFLAEHARPHPLGFVRIERAAWMDLPPELRLAALARALAAVRGSAYPPDVRPLALDTTGARLTVGGCLVEVTDGSLLVVREPGRATGQELLRPGETALWDGRFAVSYRTGPGPLVVGRLGEAGWAALPRPVRERLRTLGLPRPAIAALPGLWRDAALAACPLLAAYGLRSSSEFTATMVLHATTPLAVAAFQGANVVSKPQRLIYRSGTGDEPAAGTVATGPR
jgi:tRNA(Ile)-lysidine synthase